MGKVLTTKLNFSKWAFASLALIAVVILVLFALNDIFPLSVDIYYHILSAKGFEKAGGISLVDYWNFAPTGRPNLYPPFLSFLLSVIFKAGLDPITAARLICVSTFSLFLAVLWFVIRKCIGESEAFFSVLSALLPYTFFLSLVNQLPAAIALIIFLLVYYFVEKDDYLAVTGLLGFSFYVHMSAPWLITATLLLYGIFRRDRLKNILIAALCGILIGLPWIVNILAHRRFFDLSLIVKGGVAEYYISLLIFGVAGIVIVLRRKWCKKYAFVLASFFAVFLVAFRYSGRIFGGEGLLPLIIFSGTSLNYGYDKIKHRLGDKIIIPLLAAIIIIVISPAFFIWVGDNPLARAGEKHFLVCGSTLPRLLSFYERQAKGSAVFNPMEMSLVFGKSTRKEAAFIKANSKDDEIIFSDIPYLAGLMGVLSGRFISSGMLYEVKPYDLERARIPDSGIIVWLKESENSNADIGRVNKKYNLRKIYEDDLVDIYKNDNPRAKAVIRRADISYAQAGLFFLLLFLFAIHKRF